jgi:hypothetical protein
MTVPSPESHPAPPAVPCSLLLSRGLEWQKRVPFPGIRLRTAGLGAIPSLAVLVGGKAVPFPWTRISPHANYNAFVRSSQRLNGVGYQEEYRGGRGKKWSADGLVPSPTGLLLPSTLPSASSRFQFSKAQRIFSDAHLGLSLLSFDAPCPPSTVAVRASFRLDVRNRSRALPEEAKPCTPPLRSLALSLVQLPPVI